MTRTCYQEIGSELSTFQTLGLNTAARICLRGSLSGAGSSFNQSRMTFLASFKCVLVAPVAGDPDSPPVQLYLRLYEMTQMEENFKYHVVCRLLSPEGRLRSFMCLVRYAALEIIFKILQPTGSNEILAHDAIGSTKASHGGQSDSDSQLRGRRRIHCVRPEHLTLAPSGNPAPGNHAMCPEYWAAGLAIETQTPRV